MNRDVQRIIDSKEYGELFPQTSLSGKNIRTVAGSNYLLAADLPERDPETSYMSHDEQDGGAGDNDEPSPSVGAAQAYIKQQGTGLITNLATEQRDAIQAIVAQAAHYDTITADSLSHKIRPVIGLTKPQTIANLKHFNAVKTALLKAHPRMTIERAEKKARDSAAKYAARQHRYRAMNIARTELATAYNQGGYGATKDAQERGYIGDCKKTWLTADDERVCPMCGGVDGESVNMDALFSIGKLLPPAHPSCRCAVAYEEIGEPIPSSIHETDGTGELWGRKPVISTMINQDGSVTDNLLTTNDAQSTIWVGDKLINITEESIERIPLAECNVLPPELWERLRYENRELLRFIRDDVPGTEAIAYFSLDMIRLDRYKGEPGAGQVFPKTFDTPHIAAHTHPDGNTFSLNDLVPFIKNQNTVMMCAIGNNGKLYTLEKLSSYEAANTIHAYIKALENAPYQRDAYEQYVEFVENFYTSIQKYGLNYRRS